MKCKDCKYASPHPIEEHAYFCLRREAGNAYKRVKHKDECEYYQKKKKS